MPVSNLSEDLYKIEMYNNPDAPSSRMKQFIEKNQTVKKCLRNLKANEELKNF